LIVYTSFAQVVDLIREKRDMKLLYEVEAGVRLARYAPGRIEFELAPSADEQLPSRLAQRLQSWTGARWGVSVVSTGGALTIEEDRNKEAIADRQEAMQSALVQAVFAAFPGAKISAIRIPAAIAAIDALPQVDDEWDPFEDN
jgi:DNA polymerase-3 subunit gamma/tau